MRRGTRYSIQNKNKSKLDLVQLLLNRTYAFSSPAALSDAPLVAALDVWTTEATKLADSAFWFAPATPVPGSDDAHTG
jgi:hypothetical protein